MYGKLYDYEGKILAPLIGSDDAFYSVEFAPSRHVFVKVARVAVANMRSWSIDVVGVWKPG